MRRLAILLALVSLAGGAQTMEFAPRVVSEDRADAYSLTTFAQHPRWRGLSGDALAWELYQYLADTRTGLFHMNEVLEGDDDLNEYRTIRDPIKIINVYGYAYCAILGPVMAGIAEGVGLGEARTLVLPGWQHVASEVFYEGRWHYLDIDVRAVFRRPDGTLASMDETRADDTLWTGRGPLFFPKDDLQRTREVYRTTPQVTGSAASAKGRSLCRPRRTDCRFGWAIEGAARQVTRLTVQAVRMGSLPKEGLPPLLCYCTGPDSVPKRYPYSQSSRRRCADRRPH